MRGRPQLDLSPFPSRGMYLAIYGPFERRAEKAQSCNLVDGQPVPQQDKFQDEGRAATPVPRLFLNSS
jgi:hypothetical protein